MNGWRRCGTYIQWNTIQPEKEWSFAICSNMDGSYGHYAKWDESDGERQILYDIAQIWNLKSTTN